jgi:hypothetical protein
VGKVAGSFYLILVDHQPSRFALATLRAAALYTAVASLAASATYIAGEQLPVDSCAMQLYCKGCATEQSNL